MFDSLLQFENILINPIFVAFIVALIVDVLGYIENKVRNTETKFSVKMTLETLAKYEALIILFTTYLPIEQAVFGAFIADIVIRLVKRVKPTPITPAA